MNSWCLLRTLSLGFTLLAAGCLHSVQYVPLPDQSKNVENPDLARIYVMMLQRIGRIPIWDGESKVGKVVPHGFLCWERPPGDTEIAAWKACLPVRLETGNVYYVLLHQPGMLSTVLEVGLLSPADGQTTLRECRPPEVRVLE